MGDKNPYRENAKHIKQSFCYVWIPLLETQDKNKFFMQ